MIAHGYGIAAIASPKLVFSNVLWGYLVRAIPEINGVLGYSIATLSVLVIAGSAVTYGLFQLGVGYVTCLSVLALILVRPVLFPQFTINAGLLTVSAIICWYLYAKHNDLRTLVVGCLLAFLGYLVRNGEFLFVFIVALPLLPWREIFFRRAAKIIFFVLVLAIAASAIVDHIAYQGDEWKPFIDFNPSRAAITDFGAGEHLKQRPDILERHGYSSNDIDLLTQWFFVDLNISNPQSLREMLTEQGPVPIQRGALTNGWHGLQTLWHPSLLPLVFVACCLAVLRPSWQLTAS